MTILSFNNNSHIDFFFLNNLGEEQNLNEPQTMFCE